MKKTFTAFVALIALLTALASCENVSYQSDSSDANESKSPYTEVEDLLPPPSDETPERQVCSIVTNDVSAFYQDESSPSLVNQALEQRNDFLKERYNIEVRVYKYKYNDAVSELRKAVESGYDFCDLISLPAEETVKLYLDGLLYDINKLPNFDPTSEIFGDPNTLKLATNKTLYMIPDASAMIYDDLNVLFFNRDLLAEGLEDPETLVQQGKWTWDKFGEMAKASSVLSKGRYGFGTYYVGDEFSMPMWMSAGRHIIDNTYKNPVEFTMEVDEMTEITDKLLSEYNVTYIYTKHGDDAARAFEGGDIAFFFHKMRYLYALRDGTPKGDNFGFLPMPKYKESQGGYYCLAGNEARVLSLPATVAFDSDSRRDAIYALLATTCAVGGKTLKEAYVKSTLTDYLNRNSEVVMLDTIADSAIFDFTWTYGSEIDGVGCATLRAVCDRINYDSILWSTVKRNIKTFNKYVEEHFNK